MRPLRSVTMTARITGSSAAEIAESIRDLVERGDLLPGDALPPVRDLAAQLSVNRNTANAAYRRLAEIGLTTGRGRAGTVVAAAPRSPRDLQVDASLVDLGSGNPDPAFIPQATVTTTPVLYGAPPIDDGLRELMAGYLLPDLNHPQAQLAVTAGALDAIERILAARLGRDEVVAVEDPGLLASIDTARIGGYRVVPVRVDRQGMLPESLAAALKAGARAVIYTPRAQNPTGACLSEERARELRRILASHPDVLLIEDDHFALLAPLSYRGLITPDRLRFALIRSASAALGPDAGVALVAADPTTTESLRHRQGPGNTWVSHILQRLVHTQLTDPGSRALVSRASKHYEARGQQIADAINELGVGNLSAHSGCGLNTWVTLPRDADAVVAGLAERGWHVRNGADFAIAPDGNHIRVTGHSLDEAAQQRFLDDLVAVVSGQQ